MILDANGMPVLQPLVDDASTATFNTAFAAIGDQTVVVNKRNVPSVANATERNSLFPGTPAQGSRVWRRDLGWEEAYYAVYNVTTNPSGTVTAGWYPTSGRLPYFSGYRFTSGVINTTPAAWAFVTTTGYGATFTTSLVTIITPGLYNISAQITSGNGGGAQVFADLRKNTSTTIGAGAANQIGSNDFNTATVTSLTPMAAGDTVAFFVWASATLTTQGNQSRMDVRYVGPV